MVRNYHSSSARIKDLLIAHDVPAFTCEPVPGKDLDTVTKARVG